jgi:hypothetical protein
MMIKRGIMVAMEVKPTRGFDELRMAAPVETPEREAPTETPSTEPTRPEPFTQPDPKERPATCPIEDPDSGVVRCSY